MRAVTVIEEDAVRLAALQAKIEGDVLVDGVGAFLIARRVGVPHGELSAPFVEAGGLFAETVKVLVEADFFRGGHRAVVSVRVRHHRQRVPVDGAMSFRVAKLDQQRRPVDHCLQLLGRDEQAIRFLFYAPLRDVPSRFGDRPGVVAGGYWRAKGRSDADQIRCQNIKADLGLVAARDRYSVACGGVARQRVYGGEAADVDGRGGFDEQEGTKGRESEVFHGAPS